MAPRSTGGTEKEAEPENADHARSEAKQSPTRADGSPKTAAAVVQAVVAEEQRQMEMDFEGSLPVDGLAKTEDDAQVRAALDSLDDLQSTMTKRLEGAHVEQS